MVNKRKEVVISIEKYKKKLIRKILKLDRFSYNKNEGRMMLDKTGKCVFIDDVVKLIEKEVL